MFIKATLKDSRKVRRIRNYVSKWNLYMYFLILQNFLISGKKRWCQQNPRGVSRDSYSCWNLFRQGIAVPSFIIVGYVRQILERDPFCPPSVSSREKAHLNRVKRRQSKMQWSTVWSCGTNIKGKLWPRGYKLNLEEFCKKHDIPKILKDTKTTVCRCSTKQV